MSNAQLMAVVEVDKEDRIICQRDGCGHSVYKRIHIVRENGRFTVLGSECFKLLYGSDDTGAVPLYGSSAGQLLTDAERQVLIDNTDRFIAMLEAQRLQLEHARALDLRARQEEQREREEAARIIRGASDALRDEERNAQSPALENCRRQYPGLNLATPGWQGLVYLEKLRILREGRGNRFTQPRTESSLF